MIEIIEEIKVVCIVNNVSKLTYGSFYLVDSNYHIEGFYCINNDANIKLHYPTELFITLGEWREKQIKSVLDD